MRNDSPAGLPAGSGPPSVFVRLQLNQASVRFYKPLKAKMEAIKKYFMKCYIFAAEGDVREEEGGLKSLVTQAPTLEGIIMFTRFFQ